MKNCKSTLGVFLFLSGLILSLSFFKKNYKKTKTIYKLIIVEKEKKDSFINIVRATRYNPTVEQCSSNPFNTADGSHIKNSLLKERKIRWVALSRDLIYDEYRQSIFKDTSHWRGYFRFGDTIDVFSNSNAYINGKWVLHDCMNARYNNSIDFLYHVDDMKEKFGIITDVKIKINNYE